MPPTNLALAAALVLAHVLPAQTADAVDDLVRGAMKKNRIPGLQLVVVKDGKTVKDAAYGVASVELDVPVTPRTVFPVASVTKVFTATAILQLVEAKKLTLDAAVGDFVPDLPADWRPITVRQLLSHTSGLPDVVVNPVRGEWLGTDRNDALAKVKKLPMQSKPGTAWSYNQTNYLLLGLVIEKVTGERFEALAAQRFFTPLGMTATCFGDARDVVPGRATWYTRLDWSSDQPRLAKDNHVSWVVYPEWIRTAASLNTTAGELARFVAAVAAGDVVTDATLRDTMWTAVELADGTTFRMDGTLGVGLGWLVDDRPGHRSVGGSGGASVAFRHYRDDKLTVVVLTNCQGIDPDGLCDAIAGQYVAALAPGKR